MEWSNIHTVASLGLLIGIIVGFITHKTNFCTMGAVSDWVNMGSRGRMGSWVLAMGIAIAGAQLLELTGVINLAETMYRGTTLNLFSHIVGGALFGIGMTLGGGCGQRTLVRVGGGNLKALVVMIVLGITAYMTLRGIIGLLRVDYVEPLAMDLSTAGFEEQGVASMLAQLVGLESAQALRWLVALLVSALLIIWAFRQEGLRGDGNNILAGVVVGLMVLAAWLVTGVIGVDDFDPVPVEGLSFVAPTGNSISYLMTFTGSTINFGIATVFGVILGSFLYAVLTGNFRIETFAQREDMVNHLWGGVLMGVGGVLGLGCTIGQGVTGLSTLALGSVITVLSIMLGSAVTMRVQYYRMDEEGYPAAVGKGIADIFLPWRSTVD